MKKIAVDTNILVRLLITLDTEQSRIAEKLLETGVLFVLQTVILETEWVLRSIVKADRKRINDLFRSMLMTERFEIQNSDVLASALELHSVGMDFADALHLCSLNAGETFVTFDRDLVRLANKYATGASVELAS